MTKTLGEVADGLATECLWRFNENTPVDSVHVYVKAALLSFGLEVLGRVEIKENINGDWWDNRDELKAELTQEGKS